MTGFLQGNLACYHPEARRRRPRVAKSVAARWPVESSSDLAVLALWKWDSRRWTRVFCCNLQGCKGKHAVFPECSCVWRPWRILERRNLTNRIWLIHLHVVRIDLLCHMW